MIGGEGALSRFSVPITCVIPLFNGERHLAETLRSVLAQTHPPLEVIVVDDGSTDNGVAVAEAFAEPVRVIRRSNGGSAAARHDGIAAARGDFIAMVDADDLWHTDKLARQVERFRQRPRLDVSLVTAENFWDDGMAAEEAQYRTHNRLRATHLFDAILAPRSVFLQVPIDPTMTRVEGVEWFVRAAEASLEIDVIPDVLVYRRMHRKSVSHAHPADSTDRHLDLVKATLDRRRAAAAQRES